MTELPPREPVDRRESVRVYDDAAGEYRERVVQDVGSEQRQDLYRINQFIWLIGGLIIALIAIRVVLKAIAANPNNGFANFIYSITAPLLAPFAGLTATPSADGFILEISSVIAMIVYLLLTWLVAKLVTILLDRSSSRTVTTYDRR